VRTANPDFVADASEMKRGAPRWAGHPRKDPFFQWLSNASLQTESGLLLDFSYRDLAFKPLSPGQLQSTRHRARYLHVVFDVVNRARCSFLLQRLEWAGKRPVRRILVEGIRGPQQTPLKPPSWWTRANGGDFTAFAYSASLSPSIRISRYRPSHC
jgi:hypothetical protein